MALLSGDLAPGFTLASMLDRLVENLTLSSLRSQYIMLLFYPVDYGYVAPTKFYALESLLPSPADLPCSVLAVSTGRPPGPISSLCDRDFCHYFNCSIGSIASIGSIGIIQPSIVRSIVRKFPCDRTALTAVDSTAMQSTAVQSTAVHDRQRRS